MRLVATTMITLALGIGVLPAHADDRAELAEKCNAMALKAHPTSLPDQQAASNLRHNYFKLCLAREGRIRPPEAATTGQGQ